MNTAATILLGALLALAIVFIIRWYLIEKSSGRPVGEWAPGWLRPVIGFVTNFFDTLGIGSFATTTSTFKLLKMVPDEQIPGTLNVGHALPTVAQAVYFIAVVEVDPTTLVAMIAAAVVGAWLGAGIVAKLPRRAIQVAMGAALLVAAVFFTTKNLSGDPEGGAALALTGGWLLIAVLGNFILGILMTLGIGLYAPCFALVTMLGMNPKAAFPIMMGSCAFLMPVAGIRFIRTGKYNLRAAIGLALGGIVGSLIAAHFIREMDVKTLRWLIVVVVLYTAIMMLRSAWKESSQPATRPAVTP